MPNYIAFREQERKDQQEFMPAEEWLTEYNQKEGNRDVTIALAYAAGCVSGAVGFCAFVCWCEKQIRNICSERKTPTTTPALPVACKGSADITELGSKLSAPLLRGLHNTGVADYANLSRLEDR